MLADVHADAARSVTSPPLPQGAVVDDATQPDRARRSPHVTAAVVLGTGLVLTAVLIAATKSAYDNNEDRLLRQRTREAATVLTAALPSIQIPIASAAEVAEQDDGEQAAFQRLMSPLVEADRRFVSASLWRADDDAPTPGVVVGAQPKLGERPPNEVRAFLERAVGAADMSVIGLLDGDDPRLGYADTTSTGTVHFVAYAEAALPVDRTSVAPGDSAFAGLDHAVYLGEAEDPAQLLTASTSDLPISGRRHSESVPFGDTSLLLVMSPNTVLGGQLLSVLPWLVGGVGVAASSGAAVLVERLLRRRDQANRLASENRLLYTRQLSVARTLQQSLLPQELPTAPGLAAAARYIPGVAELDIGGDWYDLMYLDDDRVLLVVGDVSGRGLHAGTMMASLRYGIRALASRGDPPATILTGLTRLIDVDDDGHFATVLCATLDLRGGVLSMANAGHPEPLLVSDGAAVFLDSNVGPPIGVTRDFDYTAVTHRIPKRSTLIAFTDGLVERRGETIDASMERLRRSVPLDTEHLEDLIDGLMVNQSHPDAHDDSAILGLQWTDPRTN